MKYTERQTFKVSKTQKKTLIILHKKYNINTSQFIRDAIDEKIIKEKDRLFKNHKEINKYIKVKNKCPF